MPRLVHFSAALLLVVTARQTSLHPVKDALVQTKSEILPFGSSNHHHALAYKLPKYTPGDACGVHKDCKECLINQVCVWLPFGGACVEDRDPKHKYGTMQCGTWTPDVLPVVTNEHDDYRLFHTRNDPRDFNIASLGGGQDVYGLAVDLESKSANDPDRLLATNSGGEIIDGVTRKAFNGQLLEHDFTGKMLPIGHEGEETKSACPCAKDPIKFAAKQCDCGYTEFIPNTQDN